MEKESSKMNKGVYIIIGIILGLLAGGGAVYYLSGPPVAERAMEAASGPGAGARKEGRKILYWKAPMDPTYIRDEPGKSPMGMDLVPVYEGEEEGAEPGTVKIDPVMVQNIGVRTAPVERMRLTRSIRTVGRVDYDEKRVYKLHTKIDGWVEKLYFDYTGQEVKKGDILLEFYSPKLISAQEEFVMARRFAGEIKEVGRESLLELARRRLELWDVPEHQVKDLEKTGRVMRTLHIHSPANGVVVEKPVVEGMYVKPGTNLYTIADISRVWVYADIYEYELPWIRAGQEAEMTLASQPGRVFRGKVTFIYPFMEQKTRTNKVRLEFDNPDLKLKPDMYVNVRLLPVVGKSALAVPKEAVLLSGERSIVIAARGEGKFTPKAVTLGVETDDHYQVIGGLAEGETVVTSAQFLIDSESRLREAVTKMLEMKKGGDGGMEGTDGPGMEGMDHGTMNMKGTGEPAGAGHQGMEMHDMKDMDHPGMEGMGHPGTDGTEQMDGGEMKGMEHGGHGTMEGM